MLKQKSITFYNLHTYLHKLFILRTTIALPRSIISKHTLEKMSFSNKIQYFTQIKVKKPSFINTLVEFSVNKIFFFCNLNLKLNYNIEKL